MSENKPTFREKAEDIFVKYGDFMGGDVATNEVLDIDEALEAILNLLKEELEGLTVIGQDPVAKAQLQHTIKELKEKFGGLTDE